MQASKSFEFWKSLRKVAPFCYSSGLRSGGLEREKGLRVCEEVKGDVCWDRDNRLGVVEEKEEEEEEEDKDSENWESKTKEHKGVSHW